LQLLSDHLSGYTAYVGRGQPAVAPQGGYQQTGQRNILERQSAYKQPIPELYLVYYV